MCAKPLARLFDHFDAAATFASEWIRRRRADDPIARGATKALEVLSNKVVFERGMVVDCAEATLQPTRFMDTWTQSPMTKPTSLQGCANYAMCAITSS